jgi:ATP-dependent helicase/nuclease subunit A
MADDPTGDNKPQIITVRSSAGSGKTYRLAQHYLKVLLASALYDSTLPTRMANIVAITFTNKAAQEMRTRIIDWMKRIILDVPFENSTVKPLDTIMPGILKLPAGPEVAGENGPAADVTRKVRDYLIGAMDGRFSELLSDFGHFNVGTIDSFVNLTLKASAMQLNLPPDFDVTTETQELIDSALQEALRKTGEDPRVRAIFDRFLENYIDLEGDQTEWVPKGSLASMITALWNEETRENKEFIVPPDSTYGALSSARGEIAETARRLLDSFNAQSALVPHANVKKALEKSLTEPLASSSYFDRGLQEGMTKKSCPPGDEDIGLWNALVTLRRSYAVTLSMSRGLPYLDVFGLFKHIFTTEILPRRRVVPIEELNRLLITIMDRGDLIPEICYTLSEQYLHFLIDEFQDTSLLQWKNIEILADEALSRGGSLFLVGDKKQAIYRWRGGRSELVDDVAQRYGSTYTPEKLDLDTNYRSGEHIVSFNNAVFREENLGELARAHLKDHAEEDIREVVRPYCNSAQKFLDAKRTAGYVSIEHLDGDNGDEGTPEALTKEEAGIVVEGRVRAIIQELLSRRAFAERDIAFLVRTREEARTIVGILLSMDLNVESEYTVSIKNNPLVREIISLLKFIDRPDDDLSFASFITGRIFRQKTGTETPVIVDWLTAKRLSGAPRSLYLDFRTDHTELYDTGFRNFIERSGYLPLYDLMTELIRHWEIMARFPDDVPYVLHFLEVIKDLEHEGIATIKGLTDRVSGAVRGKEDDSMWLLNAPESFNAIKVLTIHKAKGLQFPVVILPFISLSSFGSLGGADKQRFFEAGDDGLKMLYLKKEYIEASPELNDVYRSKEREYLADELNNLYVAMTRAKEELYVLLTERKGKKNYLRDHLFRIPEFEAGVCGNRITLGDRRPAGREAAPYMPPAAPLSFGDLTGVSKRVLKVRTLSSSASGYGAHSVQARKMGDAMHRALSLVHALPVDDAFIASVCRAAAALEHATEITDDIISSVTAFLGNPAFRRFFEPAPGTMAYNEKEIVDGAGNTFKLDRLIVGPAAVDVIDYKTGGGRSEQHTEQVNRYGSLVSDIYPGKEVRKYILYVERGEVLEA